MSYRVEVSGDILNLAEELREEMIPSAKAVAAEGADMLLADVQRRLRLRAGTLKTAAPAGEPPEYDLGNLYRSFTRLKPKVLGAVAISGIQSDDPAVNRDEYGATDSRGIRTFPHPFVRPALDATEPKIDALLAERIPQ